MFFHFNCVNAVPAVTVEHNCSLCSKEVLLWIQHSNQKYSLKLCFQYGCAPLAIRLPHVRRAATKACLERPRGSSFTNLSIKPHACWTRPAVSVARHKSILFKQQMSCAVKAALKSIFFIESLYVCYAKYAADTKRSGLFLKAQQPHQQPILWASCHIVEQQSEAKGKKIKRVTSNNQAPDTFFKKPSIKKST